MESIKDKKFDNIKPDSNKDNNIPQEINHNKEDDFKIKKYNEFKFSNAVKISKNRKFKAGFNNDNNNSLELKIKLNTKQNLKIEVQKNNTNNNNNNKAYYFFEIFFYIFLFHIFFFFNYFSKFINNKFYFAFHVIAYVIIIVIIIIIGNRKVLRIIKAKLKIEKSKLNKLLKIILED